LPRRSGNAHFWPSFPRILPIAKGKTVRGIFRSNKLFAPPLDPFRVSFRVRPCLADLWLLALLGFASCQNRWRARFRSSRDRQFLVLAETPAPGPRPSPLGRRAGHNRRLGLRRQNGPSVTTVAEEVYSPISLLCWYVQTHQTNPGRTFFVLCNRNPM
jgi:hypothetical protein